jgi:hypothetical protein
VSVCHLLLCWVRRMEISEESNLQLEQVEVLLKSDDDIDISSWELQVCSVWF